MPGEYAESWKKWEEVAGRAILHGTPSELKAMGAAMTSAFAHLQPPPPETVDVHENEVEGIKYRVYRPQSESGPLPIAIWTHGGGYMIGDLDFDHLLCMAISDQTRSAVVNVDYRLTPDFTWPVQLEDSLKVYRWAHQNASSFGGDASRIFTMGVSAGGGLALQIANQVLRDPVLKGSLKGIVANVPTTTHWDGVPEQYRSMYTSYEQNKAGTPVIDKKSMEIFYEYLGADANDPSLFTILATDVHRDFPPVYFSSCEFDPLRDDAFVMERALNEAGVKTRHDYYPGLPHCFWTVPTLPESKTWTSNLFAGIEWLKSQS